MKSLAITLTTGSGNTVSTVGNGSVWVASPYHGHNLFASIHGNDIVISMNDSTTSKSSQGKTSLKHNHSLNLSIDGSGILSGQVVEANFKSAAPAKTIDLKGTAWYRGRLQSLWTGIAIGSDTGPKDNGRRSSIKIILKRNPMDGVSFSDRTVYSNTDVLADYYDNAYKKGWNDYKSAMKYEYKRLDVSCTGTCTCGESVTCTG